jgi:drug/metabolite transporter (DMT)-like permease
LADAPRQKTGDVNPAHQSASVAPSVAAAGLSGPFWGATFMICACTCFALMAVCIRYLKDDQTSIDITFWRSLFGTCFMLPFMIRGLRSGVFRTQKLGLMSLRAVFTYIAMVTYFYAIANMSIVDAVALNATIPLFTAVLAAFLLPEIVGIRRWTATLIGFGGALLVVRPGFQELSLSVFFAVGSAVFYAGAGIVVKVLSRTEPTTRIVFYMNLILLLIALVPWAIHWNMPKSWEAVGFLLGIGLSGTLAHICVTRALAAADASFCAPFDFWRLFMVTIFGWLLFEDAGSVWTWIGGVIIFSSAAYITRREAQVSRAAKAA